MKVQDLILAGTIYDVPVNKPNSRIPRKKNYLALEEYFSINLPT
jgi:hypothetical protein